MSFHPRRFFFRLRFWAGILFVLIWGVIIASLAGYGPKALFDTGVDSLLIFAKG